MQTLEDELNGIYTVLELGAGKTSYIRKTKLKQIHITAIDIHASSLEIARINNVYDDYILGDINKN